MGWLSMVVALAVIVLALSLAVIVLALSLAAGSCSRTTSLLNWPVGAAARTLLA